MDALKTVLAQLNASDKKNADEVVRSRIFLSVIIALAEGTPASSKTIATALEIPHLSAFGTIQSFEARSVSTSTESTSQGYDILAEGKTCIANGSPAFRVYEVVKAAEAAGSPISREKLIEDLGEVGTFGFARAMKAKWVKLDNGVLVSTAEVSSDEDRDLLQAIVAQGEAAFAWVAEQPKPVQTAIADMLKRKLLSQVKLSVRDNIAKGALFDANLAAAQQAAAAYLAAPTAALPVFDAVKPESTITAEMVQRGAWRSTAFKALNLNAAGRLPKGGNLHPLLKVRAQFRRILMQMGFEEMPTDRWVESSFWNFDSLFQPQQHPARDAHDTFFVEPAQANKDLIPKDYFELVRKTHEEGGFGSLGWRYNWSEQEALSTVLRTHTTAVSSRMLYKLAKDTEEQGVFTPKKYFSIDRVFRNEKLDATHLAEFQQVEGLVADRDLTLADLMGIIREFFAKIGITQLWFKPAYNPYTEPSMEIFGYHPLLKKRVELGNSGIFRPEMLRPMGLPADVRVIAWGLSLERPTMISYGIDNIRDLSGHRVDLQGLRKNPLCWMD